MPLTAAVSASPTVASTVGSAATGRSQEPTTPASKRERAMASTHTSRSRRPRRHEPSASSSSASSSSSSSVSSPPVDSSHHHRSHRLVGVFSKRKGVRYNSDGRVVTCRFCEILRDRDEPFLYEDDSLVVFRPLHPIVTSHILIVPRAHIRNVNQLTVDHVALVRRMRAVGDRVLHSHPDVLHSMENAPRKEEEHAPHSPHSPNDVSAACPDLTLADLDDDGVSDTDGRFAFHVPPFNSIDHVHMHAFRGDPGYVGRIKYRTESWWCRSYDEVIARLELQQQQQQQPSPPHDHHRHRPLASTAAPAAQVCS